MTDKPEFIDMISEATRQSRRRFPAAAPIHHPPIQERSRIGHWPPQRWADWRSETLTPWKLKPWKSE